MANIAAEKRDGTGKGVARQLRRDARIPAVVYGAGKENLNISLSLKEFSKLMETEGQSLKTNTHELKVGAARKELVLVRDIQIHPLNSRPVHVDLLRFDPTKRIEVEIPVAIVGEEKSPGVKRGGIIQVVRHHLAIHCLAGDIPEEIPVDVSQLEIGESVHIQDIALPEGSEVHTDVNFTVAVVVGVKGESAASSESEEEGED